jgi:ABC-type dipeptide/oligopeptide/nickel transport system permease component
MFFSFLMVRLQPGGPFDSTAGGNPMPENLRILMETRYALHLPFQEQFLVYIGNVLQGDLGPMLQTRNLTVNEVVSQALPVTLQLGFMSLILGLFIGIPAGIIAALRHNRPMDYLATFVAVLGISIPNLVLAPVLVLFFGLRLGWFPIAFWASTPPYFLGFLPRFDLEFFKHAVLPTVTLATLVSATIARLVRSSLLEVMGQDYIRTARAKGLRERMVITVHALKNALIPTITILGPIFVTLLPGMVVVENIFAINGLARTMVESVFDREYFLLSSSILVFAVVLVTGNLIADILYVWLDPRISYREANG